MTDFSRRKEPVIHFLAEQDGQSEQRLKSALYQLFESKSVVLRAYLVQVRYGGDSRFNVALAIVGVPESRREELVVSVNGIFHSMFSTGQHLDILFPSEAQETAIESVCHAFYRNPPGKPGKPGDGRNVDGARS